MTAMRGISAGRAQQAHGLLLGLRAHTMIVAGAIGQALQLAPGGPEAATDQTQRRAVILFCADQGFVGAFNEHMLDAVENGARGKDVFLIGTRGATLAGERGMPLAWHAATVPHASLIPALAGRITEALYDWLSGQGGHPVEVFVPTRILRRWSRAGAAFAASVRLWPLRHSAAGQAPLTTLQPAVLLARLAEEYIFAELCEAALTAFAMENEARVATMQSAKGNLEGMRSDLQALQRQIRQEEITAEVLELRLGA